MTSVQRRLSLSELLAALPPGTRTLGDPDREICALTADSRAVTAGALFVALRGERTDGHRFVGEAVRRGAAAVVMEEPQPLPAHATGIVVADSMRALSHLADTFYGHPSGDLEVVGVTGTNGKTTTSQMIGAILNAAGIAAGTIGTIGARLGERRWPLANTTPLAHDLHAFLAEMRALGARAVAMEVSSHALSLQRVADVQFAVGALTNVTRDHLDFHGTIESYALAKRLLFERSRRCAVNVDDEFGARWAAEFRSRKPVRTYAIGSHDADVRAEAIEVRAGGSTFRVGGARFELRMPGRFNVANALCAIAVARYFDVTNATAGEGLLAMERVPGRMDCVRGCGVDVVIDYAHTPDSLERALQALRETTPGRLILVFGCGGDRDRGKRPEMGAVAARLSDVAYVTSDNPRGEDPQAIAGEIVSGIGGGAHVVELDRRSAIEAAIEQARPGDAVLIAGKGHEDYQEIAGERLPFDDLTVAREALARRELQT